MSLKEPPKNEVKESLFFTTNKGLAEVSQILAADPDVLGFNAERSILGDHEWTVTVSFAVMNLTTLQSEISKRLNAALGNDQTYRDL
jgi:hypothetical protein